MSPGSQCQEEVTPMSTVRCVGAFISSLLLSAVVSVATAQGWPSKSVTVIVPWPPGGPSDTAARPMAKGLQEALGKPFIIDNRGGAGGNIGTELLVKAPPDGHTIMITSSAPMSSTRASTRRCLSTPR